MRDEKCVTQTLFTAELAIRVLNEIKVEEHDGDVRFYTGSGNTAVSRMRNEKYAI